MPIDRQTKNVQAFRHWNLEAALEIVGGDRSVLSEMIDSCVADFPAHLAALQEAVTAGDMESVGHWAHRLKGGCSLLCAEDAFAAALELERAATGEGTVKIAPAYHRLSNGLEGLIAELKAYQGERADPDDQ